MLAYFNDLALPWLALGGGGYNVEVVARVWSLVYAAQSQINLPDALPDRYVAQYGGDPLRDPETRLATDDVDRAEQFARASVAELSTALGWD